MKFIFTIIYNLKFEEDENTFILEELYNNSKISKISILSQLKIFKNSHRDFLYDEQKFDSYEEHWKTLKEKQIALREEKIQQENKKKEQYLENELNRKRKKQKIILYFGAGVTILIGLIIIGILVF